MKNKNEMNEFIKLFNDKNIKKLLKEVSFFNFYGMFFVDDKHIVIDHDISNKKFKKKFTKIKRSKGISLFEEFMGLTYEEDSKFSLNMNMNSDDLLQRFTLLAILSKQL